jgi:hypothetical protein
MTCRNSSSRCSRILIALLLAIPGAASAQSSDVFVAGWDFSQYIGPNTPSTDCATLSTSLPANYSDFDPTFGAGLESAAFGTMYNDGSNGSTDSITAMVPFTPNSTAITANIDVPDNEMPVGDVPFNSLVIQDLEIPGRCAVHTEVSLINLAAHMVVFEADLSSLAPAAKPSGTEWFVSFGGRTAQSGTVDVDIDFAAGAGSYAFVDTVTFTSSEQRFEVPLGSSPEDNVFVRLVFPTPAGSGQEAIFDNVAITLPEPASGGAAAALVTLLALARARRLRSAR